MRSSSLGLAAMAVCLVSGSSSAFDTGIAGRSGKQGITCMNGCHGTNAPSPVAPTVELSGPASLAAGATGDYTLIIRGGPGVRAGYNVAVSDNGGTLEAGTGSQLLNGELTHAGARDFVGGEARFDFKLKATSTPGTVTLFGAGNSTNGNDANSGDHAVASKLDITVTGATGANPPGQEDADGGCAAAGGPPLAALLVLLARAVRRRA